MEFFQMNTFLRKVFFTYFLFLFFCSSSLAAQKKYFVEPYAGYEIGKLTEEITEYKSSLLGLRAGGKFGLIFSAGVDLSHRFGRAGKFASINKEVLKDTVDEAKRIDYRLTEIGLFAMADLDFLVRFYGVYLLKTQAPHDAGNVNGKGMRLGASFTGLKPIVLNLEISLRDLKDASSKQKLKTSGTYALTVSLPLP